VIKTKTYLMKKIINKVAINTLVPGFTYKNKKGEVEKPKNNLTI